MEMGIGWEKSSKCFFLNLFLRGDREVEAEENGCIYISIHLSTYLPTIPPYLTSTLPYLV